MQLESLHNAGYIHQDIKPENVTLGLGKDTATIHLIDFGMAKSYKKYKSQDHIEEKMSGLMFGTLLYASVNAHKGMLLSRRDDIQSLVFMLIYMCNGELPWPQIDDPSQE